MQIPPLRTLDDVVALGKEVFEKGYTALKTNVFLLDGKPRLNAPGFARGDHFPELNAERAVVRAIRDQLAAFREGTGPDVDVLVDLDRDAGDRGRPPAALRRAGLGHRGQRGSGPRPSAAQLSARRGAMRPHGGNEWNLTAAARISPHRLAGGRHQPKRERHGQESCP